MAQPTKGLTKGPACFQNLGPNAMGNLCMSAEEALTLLWNSMSSKSECQSSRKRRRANTGEEVKRGLENWTFVVDYWSIYKLLWSSDCWDEESSQKLKGEVPWPRPYHLFMCTSKLSQCTLERRPRSCFLHLCSKQLSDGPKLYPIMKEWAKKGGFTYTRGFFSSTKKNGVLWCGS